MKTNRVMGWITFMFLVWLQLPAQAGQLPSGESFIYRFKIGSVTDKSGFNNISRNLEAIFDNTVRFNDTTDEIIIHSDLNISKEKLSNELNHIGYALMSYRQAYIPQRDF